MAPYVPLRPNFNFATTDNSDSSRKIMVEIWATFQLNYTRRADS